MRITAGLRRHLFEPLYFLRSGSPRLARWRELEKSQYLARQSLEELQWRRLKKLWDHVWRHNPFYRNRFERQGLSQSSLKSPSDLSQLPVLTKADVRKADRDMISIPFRRQPLLHFKTGGSTGKALDLYFTETCSEIRNACARRHDRWTGWEPGEPVAAVWGNPQLAATFKQNLVDVLVQPRIYLDTMALNRESVTAFMSGWKQVRPTLLFGHAHSLYLLARYLEAGGEAVPRPRGILATSMMLPPHERRVIEQVFQRRVIDRYGCEEVSLIGCECDRHEGLHMNIEHLVIEFLTDGGRPARTGEPGQIVVTDLINHAMPFIRYRVEDVGMRLEKSCSCGRGLPLMGPVQGRVADFLIKQDGTRVAGVSLIENTLTRIPGIDQMQIVQEQMDRVRLAVVPGIAFNTQTTNELTRYFHKIMGAHVRVDVEQLETIPAEPSGKYRFSICRVDPSRREGS